ncbi:multidrug effflux MFS transporter [Saccharospirillum salsuginis]|uniref:MFS transporter n=1 Tax=Saccharospirillum salsuginis TaxID=418750 RepID=A0A918K2K4_9GAMM|nr:multidrug effflux MFS transporter [Saccharospirillum salsuginis]GGX41453.1 MFS transporter [Saccharospirillum salsuginis]
MTSRNPAAVPSTPLKLPEFIALFALMTSLTALTIDAVLPAMPVIESQFDVSDPTRVHWLVSLFIFGMVFGELLFGPLSDALGRKPAILIGLGIYALGTVIAMTADSLSVLIAGRIVQGIGVSGPKIGSRALIRDQFQGDAMARIMSFVMMLFILVPMLAPAYGQLVLAVADWRGIFYSFLVLALVVAVWLALRQPETLPVERRIPFSPVNLGRSASRIVRHPKVMAYTVVAGLIFGCQVTYYSIAQALFEDLYQAGALFPVFFALLAAGVGVASFVNGTLVMRLGMHRQTVTALAGMIVLSGVLIGLAWLGNGRTALPVFLALGFGLFFCVGLLFGNINALAMQSLGQVAGIGASLVASLSSLVAVGVSVTVGQFYNQTLYPLATGFLVCASLALMLVLAARRSNAGEIGRP